MTQQYKQGQSEDHDSYGTCDYCEEPEEYLYDSRGHLICWECLGYEDFIEANETRGGNTP